MGVNTKAYLETRPNASSAGQRGDERGHHEVGEYAYEEMVDWKRKASEEQVLPWGHSCLAVIRSQPGGRRE